MGNFAHRYCERFYRFASVIVQNRHGQDLIEYAMLAAFMAVAAAAVMPMNVGSATSTIFSRLNASLIATANGS